MGRVLGIHRYHLTPMANQVREPNIRWNSQETWMRVFGPSKSEGFRAYLPRTMGRDEGVATEF